MTYEFGDLLFLYFPFTDGNQSKLRPAILLIDTNDDDVLVARVTTQMHQSPYDILLHDWHRAGLKTSSVVRLHKLVTVHKNRIKYNLGQLSESDKTFLKLRLATMWSSL